jgi:hypothetical protein
MTDSTTRSFLRPRYLVLGLVTAALALPTAAGAAVVGSTHIGQSSQTGLFCGGFPSCAEVQTSLAGGTVKAPFTGRIRTWRVNLDVAGSLQLLVVRKQDDGSFKTVAESSPKRATVAGVQTFGASVPIRKGDLIGLNLLDGDIVIHTLNPRDAHVKAFIPAMRLGTSRMPFKPFRSPFDELQFNASIRH